MTTFDRKINQIAARHGWSIEKQPRAAVECYIIDAATYEDAGKIAAKAVQYETAVQWNAVEAFNLIYA